MLGQAAVLAAFNDGQALLARQALGQGEVYFCSTLPLLTWSELGGGMVVVPMLQRLLAAGSARLQRDSVAECGKVGAGDLQLEWTSVETSQRGDVQTQAGVYQSGDRWLVVNRPAAENEFERVEDEVVSALFGGLSFQLFQAKRDDTALQGEIWRMFLFFMLLALLVEAWLIRPRAGVESDEPTPKPQPAPPHEQLVFCNLSLILLVGTGVMVLSAWLGWSIWQRNGRRGKVGLLELLRFAAVTLLAFTFLQPEYVRLIERTEQPQVAILNDLSGSMLTRDVVSTNEIITRSEWLEEQTKREYWKPLETGSEVMIESFAAPPDLSATNAVAQPREIGTDLTAALSGLIEQQKNLKAVLMLTDGDWNLGPSPIGVATRFRDQEIPIYSIVTGQDQPIADLSLEEVTAPAYGLFGEQIAIPFTIQSHLPRDVSTEISLMSNREVLASKKITLPANSRLRDSIMWYPREVGEFNLRLDFPVEVDEALRDNNSADFHIAVRVVKLSVLVVDSQPRWEYRFLRNALARDPGVDLNCVLLHPKIAPAAAAIISPPSPGRARCSPATT